MSVAVPRCPHGYVVGQSTSWMLSLGAGLRHSISYVRLSDAECSKGTVQQANELIHIVLPDDAMEGWKCLNVNLAFSRALLLLVAQLFQ